MAKVIFGIKLEKRIEDATKVQELLTKYGCSITTRIGTHTASSGSCSPSGLIILEMVEDDPDVEKLEKELLEIDSAVVKKMEF